MIKLSINIAVWNQEKLIVRALDSVPRRNDVEVVVYNDGSTDNTLAVLRQYKKDNPDLNIRIYTDNVNRGVAHAANVLLEKCKGEYFCGLGSDDYIDTEKYCELIDGINGEDVICFDLRINDGSVWKLREDTNRLYCGQSLRFIRKAFVDGLRFPENVKAGSDWYFNEELLKRNPVTKYTCAVAYYYNFPRDGSLVNLRARGLISDEDLSP